MDRLTERFFAAFKDEAQALVHQKILNAADASAIASAFARIASLQSLSQEAVREEALSGIIDELAAIADACVDLQQNRKRPDSDPVMSWDNAPLTLGTLRKARALKREPVGLEVEANVSFGKGEPNAAATAELMDRDYRSAMGLKPRPAPAAPDVASMVKRLREAADRLNKATEGYPTSVPTIGMLLTEAAALLARLSPGASDD